LARYIFFNYPLSIKARKAYNANNLTTAPFV
jgi:hypothetical protein